MGKLCKWFWLLNKRLYKKATFLVIMALVPLCVLALSFAAKQDSGFYHVALGKEDPRDWIASGIVRALTEKESLIRFTIAPSDEAAEEMVRTGKADAAWIFPANMEEKIGEFLENKSRRNAAVRVVERQTTVFSRIAVEKLSAKMYAYCAKVQYLQHIRDRFPELEAIPDEQLQETYEGIALSEELFVFEDLQGNIRQEQAGGYITAPIRGLLATLICLCAGAATLFYMRDQQVGTFSLVKESRRLPVALGCVMIAAMNMAVVALVALGLSGLLGSILTEIAAVVLYCICCAGFWLLLKELLGSMKWLCALMPILLIGMVFLCPVFLSLGVTQRASVFLPPTYFINSAYDSNYLLYMLIYGGGLLLLTALVQKGKSLIKIK